VYYLKTIKKGFFKMSVLNHGDKQEIICNFLDQDVDMPTRTIIMNVATLHKVDISERHVQRVRKAYKEEIEKSRKKSADLSANRMRKEAEEMGQQLTAEQIEILNMANEGGWSIQELADQLHVEPDTVRETLKDFHWMITGQVLDQEAEEVYFKADQDDSGENPEEEDIFNTDTGADVIELTDTVAVANVSESTGDGNEEFWEVQIETVTACSKCGREVDVFINRTARTKAMMFMKWAGPREWLAYLVGELKDGAYYITDLFLPDQRTSATLVDKVVAENYNQMTIVGVIHSHHEMGAGDEDNPSFSGHDAAFINGNHNLSLLAGRDRKTGGFKVVGIARTKTPCGAFMTIKASVKTMGEELTDEEQAMKTEFFSKTQTQTHVGNRNTHQNGKGVSGITQTGHGRSTYHFAGGGYPGNQHNFRQGKF
jgi:DNA-binding CsgD family transcriptional regulator